VNLAVLQWAYSLPGLSPASQAVLGALAFHAHKGEFEAFPDIDTLSAETRFSVKTVKRAVGDLTERGLIDVTRRWDAKGRQTSNLYTLTLASPEVTVTPLPGHCDPPTGSPRPPGEVTVTRPYKDEMGKVSGHREVGNGNGHSHSRPLLRPTGSEVAIPKGFTVHADVVPQADDPELQELIEIYVPEQRRQPWWLSPLFGHKLADHVLEAWAKVKEDEFGRAPEDLVETFRRVVRLYPRQGKKHSFASILLRYTHWEQDLEADAAGDEEDIPIPTYAGAVR
jgi:hypothetical protein